MSNEIKRMNYFNGLLLKEEDLTLEQSYHMKLQRLHNRFFHSWGIVDGLEVEEVLGSPQVTVSQGLALNRIVVEETNEKLSQEIFICDNHPDSLVDLSGYDANQDIYITVTYEEALADIDSKKGGQNEIHVWERARINHRNTMPDDPSKEIILARIRLKDNESGIKSILEISNMSADGKTEICTYAVTQGTAQEFEKISIGEKDKLNLPYIDGLIDKTLGQTDGLEIHSPFTKFSGSLISGALKTNGDVNVNGVLTVTANKTEAFTVDSKGCVNIPKTVSVGGRLSTSGGLNVSGDNTTLNTTNVIMTGNMLSINKYTPKSDETEPRNQSSGVEVYRGEMFPNAKFLWDENEKVWKAGTDKRDDIPESGLYDIAYGASWEKMHDGSNADTLHKHSKICSANGTAALSVDANGGVSIENSVTVTGSIIAMSGILVPSKQVSAKIVWNEADQHWQIGVGTEMFNIPYGEAWGELTTGTNADLLHTHSEFYSSDGQLAMSASPNGDVEVNSNLAVAKDLTVDGNLTVLGTTTEFKKMPQVVTENVVIVNKPENGEQPITEGGFEVYRGSTLPNARLIWDEGSNSWKIGIGDSLSELPSGIEWGYLTNGKLADNLHKHGSLITEKGTVAVAVDNDGNVETEGDVAIDGGLTVEKNAQVKGNLTIDGSLTLEGNLNVTGTETIVNKKTIEVDDNVIIVNKYTGQSYPLQNEGGLEVYRGGMTPNARILWNESEQTWKVGIGEDMSSIPYGDKWDTLTQKALADGLHTHGMLCDEDGKSIINVNSAGKISIEKDTKVNGVLSVEGSMVVSGILDVKTIKYLNKVDMQVEDNVILLNKYEGDSPQINESGIEIYRGMTEAKARLVWDEALKIWKIGIGEELKEIACGTQWDKLTEQGNADALHLHGQLYNEKGDVLALSTRASGNVDVAHDLTVAQDLAILGNLDVRGQLTRINSKNIEIVGNSIVLNRFDSGELPQVLSSFSVFRGDENSAILAWDEVNDIWKIGLSNSSQVLKVNIDGSIQTTAAKIEGKLDAGSANIQGSLVVKEGIEVDRYTETRASIKWNEAAKQWKIGTDAITGISTTAEGYVGIGNENPQEKLDVSGNAIVNGNMDINGSTEIKGSLTSSSADIKGSLMVGGNIAMNGGIEVLRKVDSNGNPRPSAKICWNENKGAWTFGVGDELGEIILNAQHTHHRLYTENGNAISVSTDIKGNVGIGTSNPSTKLDVAGDTLINGKATVKNSLEVTGDTLINGKVTAKNSFELFRGSDLMAAKLYWDEANDVWQAGVEGNLKDMCLSDHKHSNLCTSSGSQIINVDSIGNVAVGKAIPEAKLDVAGNLKAISISVLGGLVTGGTIKGADAEISGSLKTKSAEISQDLTVGGNLTVNGEVVTVNTTTLDVEDNIITINKYAPQATPADKNGGLEVFRGGTVPNAQIIWNETSDMWQVGTVENLRNLSYSDHTHAEIANIIGALSVNEGNIGIGTISPKAKLDVNGSAAVSGNLSAADIDLSGDLSAANADLSGILSVPTVNVSSKITSLDADVTGKLSAAAVDISGNLSVANVGISGKLTVNEGFEVYRGSSTPNAQILWDKTSNMWQAGTAGNLKKLSYSDHTHTELTTLTGAMTVNAGNIGIGTATPTAKLDVKGSIAVSEKLSAANVDISGILAVSKGIEITGATEQKAQILWNSISKKWQAGTSDALKDIEYSGHNHQKLYSSNNVEAIVVDSEGNVGIGKTPQTGIKLAVDGDVIANNITIMQQQIVTLQEQVAALIAG